VATASFQTAVPSELEALFRRGSEWEQGVELIAGLSRQPGSTAEDAREFLELTQQLATSAAFGAVQAASGPCSGVQQHAGPTELIHPDAVLLVRFQTTDELAHFIDCPPVSAMLTGDERAPLRVLWAAALKVAPAENSRSSPQGGNKPF